MGTQKVKGKLNNIEFIRFFFAAAIIYFHLLHSFMMPYTGESVIYQNLAEQSKYAKYIVECFFIISGYFLYRSLLSRPEQKTTDFLWKKIVRLWPVLAVSTVFSVVFLEVPASEGILNLFFLQSTGLTTGWTGLNWYVSAFFFSEVFYFLLHKAMKNSAGMKLLICVIAYFGYTLNIMTTDGGFGRKVVYGVFSLAMARAVAGIGTGYLLGVFYDSVKEKWEKTEGDLLHEKKRTIMISFIELGSFLFLLTDFFAGKNAGKNQFSVVVFFCIFFLCMLTEKGLLSRIISRTGFCRLGKYSYSIYVMQEAAFYILSHTLWKNAGFLKRCPAAALGLSVVLTILFGAGIYYLVERPMQTAGKN